MPSPPSAPPADADPPAADAERRLILRTVAAALAVVAAGSFAVLTTRVRDSGGADANVVGSPADAIGPPPGAPLATYRSRRAAALADVEGRRVAVVSFTRYRDETEARAALRGVRVVRWLVAPKGAGPAVVAGSLDAWVETTERELGEERDALTGMLDTEDPSFRTQFQDDIRRIDAVRAALDARGAIVFGAVVEADGDALRKLAATPPVRLVDVAAGTRVPDPTRIAGVRPEETVRAGAPPERPLEG